MAGTVIPFIYYAIIYVHVCDGCACSKKLPFKYEKNYYIKPFYLIAGNGDCFDKDVTL